MGTEEKIGRFGYHANPALDFRCEVREIELQWEAFKTGLHGGLPMGVISERVARALDFTVGGDPDAVEAKDLLRAISAEICEHQRKAAASRATPETMVEIDYTNHRGVRGIRRIVPDRVYWSSNEWHPDPQWLLDAYDLEKRGWRTFALKSIHSWVPAMAEKPAPSASRAIEMFERVRPDLDFYFSKGRTRPDEPLYAMQVMRNDQHGVTADEALVITEHDDPVALVLDVLTAVNLIEAVEHEAAKPATST